MLLHRYLSISTFAGAFQLYVMTYKELAYAALDQLKIASDDSYVTVEHAIFLASKIRAAILKQRYSDMKKEIPASNMQSIEVTFEKYNEECEPQMLRSTEEIPYTLGAGSVTISTGILGSRICFTDIERFRYTGSNRWMKNIIYAAIGDDKHLYVKSCNMQFRYLQKATITAVFEDIEKASEIATNGCDIIDERFPLEEGLVSTVIEMLVKYLGGMAYRPKDESNDAKDELSDLMTFIRRNMKSNFQKQMEE